MPLDPKFYAYARLGIVLSTVMACHGTYYYLVNYASPKTQKFWKLEGVKEKELAYQERLIVDRRRQAIKKMRKEYLPERDNFKLIFEEWVETASPDIPFRRPYYEN